MEEKQDDYIIIENGDMFEGTRAQFRDCFFDNATNEQIKRWCEQHDWSFEIKPSS